MRVGNRATTKGFTLLEMLVVTAILLFIAGLLIVSITKVQSRTMAASCMSRMRAIGTAVRSYALSCDGWTPPNGHHYPALLDHPAYDPTNPGSLDLNQARRVKNFRCPLDDSNSVKEVTGTGGYVSRGYQYSYNLASAFQGLNLFYLTNQRVVMVHEFNEPRHPNGVKVGSNYVFADLSGEVTAGTISEPQYYPGFMSNWFANVSLGPNGITTTGLPHLSMVWSEPLDRQGGDGLHFLPTVPPRWDRQGNPDEPEMILGKWNGYLDFPAAGNWKILIHCDDVGGVWVDVNGDETVQGSEYVQQGTRRAGDGNGPGWWQRPVEFEFPLNQAGKRRVFFYFFDWYGPEFFNFWWENPGAGIARQIIPVECMWHNPFGNMKPFREPINFSLTSNEIGSAPPF